VVTVFDVGQDGGRPWLAMELVPGDSLRHLLRRGPLPLRQALDLAANSPTPSPRRTRVASSTATSSPKT
jgi:serine/threonine protein kinase